MKTAIQSKLKSYRNETGKSLRDISNEVKNRNLGEISTATLSNMESGNWEKISDIMWARMRQYLGMDAWSIVETKVLLGIIDVCNEAQLSGSIKMVLGETGIGKTTSFEQYSTRYKNVFIVTCAAQMNQKEFIAEIAEALAISSEGKTKYRLIKAIAAKLLSLHTPIIILDEAGKLPTKYLSVVQSIYEMAGKKVGVVLSGVSYLYDNFMKAVTKRKVAMPELEGRINDYLHIQQKPLKADMRSVAITNGVAPEHVNELIASGIDSYRDLYHAVQKYHKDNAAQPDQNPSTSSSI